VATAYTFMDPHGVPSGGDWGLQRTAAVYFEGSVGTVVENCTFLRLDGNALMFSAYNRNTTIYNNEFAWIGDNVMAAWGNTDGIDGTNGDQPRYTNVSFNIAREMGIWQKQSSPWFQAKSAQSYIEGNLFFNGPRALINFNDGFGGGNEVVHNLLFNPNRDSSDQGPFNSWDREPFFTDVASGNPANGSVNPLYNNIHHNYWICNYGSNLCIDNDDGSSWYYNHDNFEMYGGHKSDFGGHNKFSYNNVQAYSQVYTAGACAAIFNSYLPNWVDGFYNNTCVQGTTTGYVQMSCTSSTNPDPATTIILHDNTIYNSADAVTLVASGNTVTEAYWSSKGLDTRTVANPIPSDETIMNWGIQLLGINADASEIVAKAKEHLP